MRLIALMLTAYIALVTVSPVACGVSLATTKVDQCSKSNCETQCSKDRGEGKQSDQSDNDSSCLSCCSLQNCNCCFVTVPEFNFHFEISLDTKRPPVKNDNVLSDCLSECWQPPELI